MASSTKSKRKVSYSKSEDRLLTILRSLGRTSAADLAKKFYKGREQPFSAGPSVSSFLRGLKRKVEWNGEDFRLVHTVRKGPHPIEWWIEK